MSTKLRNRFLLILGVTVVGLYLLFGPLQIKDSSGKVTPKALASNFTLTQLRANLANNIKLGLDLKGGSHLILQVKTDDAIRAVTDANMEKARSLLEEAVIKTKNATAPAPGRIEVELEDGSLIEDAKARVTTDFGPGWTARNEGARVIFEMRDEERAEIRDRTTEQAMRIIEQRVDAFGVVEPTIQRHGPPQGYQILLQLPGIGDPERVKNLIRAESRLELKLVVSGPHATEEAARQSLGEAVPADRQIFPSRERRREAGAPAIQYYVVEKASVVTGNDLRNAQALVSRTGGTIYEISFSLRPSGSERFGTVTTANVNKQLAIILNDEIKSAPNIKEPITGGEGRIEGDFTKEEAEDLALTLRSGALPASVTYLEERTVGPSLGADSIRQGFSASIVGLVAIILFMLIYYRFSGINAVIALTLNLMLLLAALKIFGAVLTLPGIAGVALTIGMAVDANVLIFERIREELRNGKVAASAVSLGFDRAFVAIFDSNVTTIVSALFLFIFGTGPIRGFAVTLTVGLVANLFTAVTVSRAIFNWVLERRVDSPKPLSI
jgi:preprotein translocase subunit SecD